MSILVTGGAGYIGSHTALELVNSGYETIIIDSLYKGHKEALPQNVKFYQGDIKDMDFLDTIFCENKIDAVIHFAADSLVGESIIYPLKYYENNVYAAIILLKAMQKYNVKHIVFSSTAATYGEPQNIPILESDPTFPTNPYGESKLAIEKMLKWSSEAYGINFIALRYFNVAGADKSGNIGEDHNPETHLIPLVLEIALNKREEIFIFGDDYETKDGTCIRDYIHVTDLANAHISALEYLKKNNKSNVFNLGNGNGFSVKEVIECCKKVTKLPIPSKVVKRRAGDPAKLIASSKKAIDILNWHPKFNELEQIVESAWNWHKSHPGGF